MARVARGGIRTAGHERGLFLLKRLEERAQELGIVSPLMPYSAYRNTIPAEKQIPYPGDLAIEGRIIAMLRWNALVMVARANPATASSAATSRPTLGGRDLRGRVQSLLPRSHEVARLGDLVFFQPHSAPGCTPAPYLEGQLTERDSRISGRSRWRRAFFLSSSLADARASGSFPPGRWASAR